MKSKWNPLNYKYREIAKAVWAFILPGVAVVGKALVNGRPIDLNVGLTAIAAMLGLGVTVFVIPNKSVPPQPNPQT